MSAKYERFHMNLRPFKYVRQWRGMFILLIALRASSALAQLAPIQLQTQTSDEGFRLFKGFSRGRLHLFGNLDFRYDSNPAFLDTQSARGGDDLVLRLRAGTQLQFPSERVEIGLTGYVDYNQYFGMRNKETRRFSGLQGSLNLNLQGNKSGKFSPYLRESFLRLSAPVNPAVQYTLFFVRNALQVGTLLSSPEGTVTGGIEYGFNALIYDSVIRPEVSVDPRSLSQLDHTLQSNISFLLRTKTQVGAVVRFNFSQYPFTTAAQPQTPVHSFALSASARQMIRDKLRLAGSIGYLRTFTLKAAPEVEQANSANSAIASLSLAWFIREGMQLSLNYGRDVTGIGFFNRVDSDSIVLSFFCNPISVMGLDVSVRYGFLNYGENREQDSAYQRRDHVFSGQIKLSYKLHRLVAGSIFYIPELRHTFFADPSVPTVNYVRHQSGFDMTVAY